MHPDGRASIPAMCRRNAASALRLAAELDPLSAADVSSEIDALATRLAALRDADPRAQLLGGVAATQERIAPVGDRCELDDVLLHRALARGAGHPLTVTIAAVEAGRRAGIPLGVVGADDERYVAHAALPAPLVLDPAAPERLVDLSGREATFGWQCAHELAGRLLEHVETRAKRAGDVGRAATARRLRRELPRAAAPCATAGEAERRRAGRPA